MSEPSARRSPPAVEGTSGDHDPRGSISLQPAHRSTSRLETRWLFSLAHRFDASCGPSYWRHAALSTEIAEFDRALGQVVSEAAPGLLALPGVGTDVAGAHLVAAGDNPERLSSEAAFARLCGVAPLPASSGRTSRHRLNRGGDRIANNALWRIVLVRMSSDPRTRYYMERRTKEGLSKKEIIRCLKRYVAREVYRRLVGVDEQ